ncbi:MAG: DUF1553 domain-containing protein [Pedosphaera sp.]|nr:DUF1553 domain-containing protein [Pedosphaera sp.]
MRRCYMKMLGFLTFSWAGLLLCLLGEATLFADDKAVLIPVKTSSFWALQAVSNSAVPAVRNKVWVRSSVDAFILATLEQKGIKPALPADRRSLIRRATFDLTGLPPNPDEVETFLEDRSPDAFARLVERLLASPRYGERWGRHWLDVARYADSNGLDENVAFGNAWRYRDYVIRSFNADKPYNLFLIEQIAGDLLPTTEDLTLRHDRLEALGFLCIGPKLLAEPDKMKLEMDIIDEQIETFGRAFLGATLGCARCHDHKFDPIPTDDYYSLAAIFKSTRTMDDLATIAKWHEPSVSTPADIQIQKAYSERLAAQKTSLTNRVSEANRLLLTALGTNALPREPERQYSSNTVAQIEALRTALKALEAEAPEPASTMGVEEGTNILKTIQVHLRGSHLTLGKSVPRRVPRAMSFGPPPEFGERQSGRLELASWLADPQHPLTARVLVNRIWRWHFGRGLVASPDNFGLLGERPSHPELLDWLAHRFVLDGWSMKSMHRLLMLSSTYQMSVNGSREVEDVDPENALLSHFSLLRLDAEEIRDNLLSVAGKLDLTMVGKTIPLKNREFVFNHTSKDATTYESPRRAVYLPVIRNHLYDLFQQFDYPDPSITSGNRAATVVAPQALMMMNSALVLEAAEGFAKRLLAPPHSSDVQRLLQAYLHAFGRTPSVLERRLAETFLRSSQTAQGRGVVSESARLEAWITLCQTLLASSEFIYLN